MNRAAVLARWDAEMRRDPPALPGETVERDGQGTVLVRDAGGTCVLAPPRTERAAAHAIARELARARRGRTRFEWKRCGHDPAPDPRPLLAAAGLSAEPVETLMVRDGAGPLPIPSLPPGWEIVPVTTEAELAEAARASEEAFGRGSGWTLGPLRGRLGGATLVLLRILSPSGETAAVGRLDLPPARAFAGLWGGATVPAHRGRGLYRVLVGARAGLARGRGYRYLTVDARPSSEPILSRLGFEALTTLEAWSWSP
ncbi:MAG: GNAT family N-acetyltransferase [Thermoplasmata archaeon]